MNDKYIFQLRRGTVEQWAAYEATKYVQSQKYDATIAYYIDKNGTIADPQPTQFEVENGNYYVRNPQYLPPLDGEIVLVYDNGIPRLKIGKDNKDCSELPCMSLDSFIMPNSAKINLYGGDQYWSAVDGYENRYTQDITDQLTGKITVNSKIDLQPTPEQLLAFQEKDVTFTTVNDEGTVRVCAIGVMPQSDYKDIQVTITEVNTNG